MIDIYLFINHVLYASALFGSMLAIAVTLTRGTLGVARRAAASALLHCAVVILAIPMFITTAVAVFLVIEIGTEIARHLEAKYHSELALVQ